ncbi:hypothetical protein AU210_015754 [Fusarium oxysporum f. sp. radicis-cucumerinum]|uniref:Uncharacterized protein n=1 Tax=Fusarium oxysporum f. sp. radicis-cucumerinum TaxID=327505 RepID=A0A2H3FR75_FUSOX|nr:hypothetical protein AU210_015754 [Fusarium oxysporum f. sp. radicis-cucumerinum]
MLLTERSVALPEHFRHLRPPRTVDNDQDVVDLMADDITDLTAHTDLADRGQLVQASIWLLSVATQQAASFSYHPRHACHMSL